MKLPANQEKKLFVKFQNPVQQDFAATFEGLNARMLPETCAPQWPHQVPAQVAIIGPDNKIIQQQIVFPQQNYGWISIPNLPPGVYTFYVQFKVDNPAQHGFDEVTFSTYGLSGCAQLAASNGCAVLSQETAFKPVKGESENKTKPVLEEDILAYQWSNDAVVLKDSIFGLLRALMAVDQKYKEIASEDIRQAEEKQRLEEEFSKLKTSIDSVNKRIIARVGESEAAKNYKGVIDQAKGTIEKITQGITKLSQVEDPSMFLQQT